MSLNFNNLLIKDKSRHTISTIKSNQNILLSQLKNYIPSSASLSRQRSKSKNNYSTKNIYHYIEKKEKTGKEKDEIIKKLKERIKSLENRIKFLEIKVKNLSKQNSNYNTSSKNSKNHSISGKENLNDKNEKKEFKSIIFPKKKYSLKAGYSKKRTSSNILTEENIYDMKERCNTIISNSNNNSNSSNLRKNSKNKKKIELNFDKFDIKKQSLNYQSINEILKKAIIKKTNLRKSKHMSNLNDLDLKTSISKLISKIPKTSRHYQTESNVNLSSKITSSTTFNYYKPNNSNNYSENNNVLTSNNNIYTEEGETKDEYVCNTNNTNAIYNNSNEIVRSKLNNIKKRTTYLLEIFAGIRINDK